jgi:hypothetical protein
MNHKGMAGCGCLIFVLIVIMVLTGALIHPITLRFIGNQFHYEDKIFTSDAIFVPRFSEDRNGELYVESFRDYSAGNGKLILVEDDTILGTSIVELVNKMARTRNVKEDGIRKIVASGEGLIKAQKIKEQIEKQGLRKVIIIVPGYAARRFHLMYGSSKTDGKTLYLIKPVPITFFKRDKWWKDSDSRGALANEAFAIGSYYLQKFKYGENEKKVSKQR